MKKQQLQPPQDLAAESLEILYEMRCSKKQNLRRDRMQVVYGWCDT